MIKFKHLLALSMTAALAANASADIEVTTPIAGIDQINISGSILAPTCVVTMSDEKVALDSVSASSFKAIGDVAGAKTFTLKLVETSTGKACPTISYVANAIGDTTPTLNITADNFTAEGYLANTEYKEGETASLAIQILNNGEALNLKTKQEISVTNTEKSEVVLSAQYIALQSVVDVQKVKASFKVNVDYK